MEWVREFPDRVRFKSNYPHIHPFKGMTIAVEISGVKLERLRTKIAIFFMRLATMVGGYKTKVIYHRKER